jgi:hypothetical protein
MEASGDEIGELFGRDVLNYVRLLLDGPGLSWLEWSSTARDAWLRSEADAFGTYGLVGVLVSDSFHILDLVSQAVAVQRRLKGKLLHEKITWLSNHGQLTPRAKTQPNEQQTYYFTSTLGFTCCFFMKDDQFVFIGDHTTFTVVESPWD